MCHPNYAQLVLSETMMGQTMIFTRTGIGSHHGLISKRMQQGGLLEANLLIDENRPNMKISKMAELRGIIPNDLLAFECMWSKSPKIQFQPDGHQWFSMDTLPTQNDFLAAQQRLNSEIGTPKKLFEWLREAHRLECDAERGSPFILKRFSGAYENFTVAGELKALLSCAIPLDEKNELAIKESLDPVTVTEEIVATNRWRYLPVGWLERWES